MYIHITYVFFLSSCCREGTETATSDSQIAVSTSSPQILVSKYHSLPKAISSLEKWLIWVGKMQDELGSIFLCQKARKNDEMQ